MDHSKNSTSNDKVDSPNAKKQRLEFFPPASFATTDDQKASLAELHQSKKYALYETLSEDNLDVFHKVSCRPITKKAEDDMELLSDILTWGERYLHHWKEGLYVCSKCNHALYSSSDKYKGPCIWPSFRQPINPSSLATTVVYPYNNYKVEVREVYCGSCDLFVGHQFEDAREKGDTHPDARWRH
jgi:peptide-methionine (R)-S-oxide reductase